MEKRKGIISVIGAGISWGVISVFIKHLSNKGLSPLEIMQLRVWFSAAMLSVYMLIKDPKLFCFKLRDIWMFIGTGVLSLTFFSLCYFTTIVECGASVAVVLLYTSPVFVLIMSSILFNERITRRKVLAMLIAFVGCVLVAGLIASSSSISISALLIGVGSGFGYALYSIFSRYALRKYNIFTIIFYTFLFSGISSIPFVNYNNIVSKLDISDSFSILGISLICTVLAYVLYTYGLKKLDTTQAAVLVTVEPLVGAAIGILLYGESHNIFKIIGMIFILMAIILLNLPEHKGIEQ